MVAAVGGYGSAYLNCFTIPLNRFSYPSIFSFSYVTELLFNIFSTYQPLYSHCNFCCYGNLTGPQIHPIIMLNFIFHKTEFDDMKIY